MSTDELHDEPTPVEGRLIDAHCLMLADPEPREIAYNHGLFCQTSLPYRNPGDNVREITRKNGAFTVEYSAGKLLDRDGNFAPVGLPYGPRARLVLIHLMTQAILNQSPRVELEDSLTAFAVRILGQKSANGGRSIRTLREQMRRMAACSVRIAVNPRRAPQAPRGQFQAHIVEGLELYSPTEPRQRVLWPSYVELNHQFFGHLLEHAVPLDPRALRALSHSASALDCYQWLAQRLHRVGNRGMLLTWNTLHRQLGGENKSAAAWRANFIGRPGRAGILPQVLAAYPAAREAVEVTDVGLKLRQAEPPVPKWGHVQQRRASFGGGQILKRPQLEARAVQLDTSNPACPECGQRATQAVWGERDKLGCTRCGHCLDGSRWGLDGDELTPRNGPFPRTASPSFLG